MKKIILVILFFLSSCGFEPIYVNKDINNYEFKKVNVQGESIINKSILEGTKLRENKLNQNLNELTINSYSETRQISKNSKGNILTYITLIRVNIIIIKNDGSLIKKEFFKNFTYNKKDKKIDLIKYQEDIKLSLTSAIIKDIILFLNTQ